jgi:hypothetical protein
MTRRHDERRYASPFNHEVMIYCLVSWICVYFIAQFLRWVF